MIILAKRKKQNTKINIVNNNLYKFENNRIQPSK